MEIGKDLSEGGYAAVCEAIEAHAADMVKRRAVCRAQWRSCRSQGGGGECDEHGRGDVQGTSEAATVLRAGEADLKQIRDTARAAVSPTLLAAVPPAGVGAPPEIERAPMGDSRPKPPVEKDVVQRDDQN